MAFDSCADSGFVKFVEGREVEEGRHENYTNSVSRQTDGVPRAISGHRCQCPSPAMVRYGTLRRIPVQLGTSPRSLIPFEHSPPGIFDFTGSTECRCVNRWSLVRCSPSTAAPAVTDPKHNHPGCAMRYSVSCLIG